jgi:hypothetical protein
MYCTGHYMYLPLGYMRMAISGWKEYVIHSQDFHANADNKHDDTKYSIHIYHLLLKVQKQPEQIFLSLLKFSIGTLQV